MFEKRNEPIATFSVFIFRLFYTFLGGIILIAIILLLGSWSLHLYQKIGWMDAFTNAAMTFADMGLVIPPQTNAAKLFASLYALFCQFAFFVIFALIFSPIIHRFYHKFHKPNSKHGQK